MDNGIEAFELSSAFVLPFLDGCASYSRRQVSGTTRRSRKLALNSNDKPDASIRVEKRMNGRWAFVLSYRGVTYPAQGQFSTELHAQAAAHAAMKLLRNRR